MTVGEAYYVLDHWREYHADTVQYAREIIDSYEQQR